MNAPETGAHPSHVTDAGLPPDPPGWTRLRQLADQQAALRRLAMLIARGEPPEAIFAAATREALRHFTFSLHSPKGGGTAVSCELPVPAWGGRLAAGHVE